MQPLLRELLQALVFFLYTFGITASIVTVGMFIMFAVEWWKGRHDVR